MEYTLTRPSIKTALFIDFDNIFLGLGGFSQEAANRFATQPDHWLDWIERGMPSSEENGTDKTAASRAVILRNCYANPQTIQHYRGYFTRSAFSVIDCPAITGQPNKNSADIRMVMDVLDALEHKTRFDEFILFSGDSDFMPLLLRLRVHDRRTAIVTVGPTAGAYKAAADHVVEVDTFIIDGLELDFNASSRSPSDSNKRLIHRIADRLADVVSTQGELTREQVTSVYLEFEEFRMSSTWLGFFNKRLLTQEVIRLRPELSITEDEYWKVVYNEDYPLAQTFSEPISTSPKPVGYVQLSSINGVDLDLEDLKMKIFNLANRMVQQSDEPVLMVIVADEARKLYGDAVDKTHWAGAGTFRNLLESCPDPAFKIAFPSNVPGVLFDPERYTPPEDELPNKNLEGLSQDLANFIRHVSQVTATPGLSPDNYAKIFQAISAELKVGSYNPNLISKNVRDFAVQRKISISRKNIWFILVGIQYGGHDYNNSPENSSPAALARAFHRNTLNLCRGAQWELSEEEQRLLDLWILEGTVEGRDSEECAPSGEQLL